MPAHLLDAYYHRLSQPLRLWARALLLVLPALLVLAFFSPLWHMHLDAPQYPGGLDLEVFAYKVDGGREGRDLQEINTLNHYIGMRPINRAELADLDWIPFALGFLVIFGLRVAAVGDIRALVDLMVLSFYFSGFALARFVYKLYDFGHHLHPGAPFKVDPFTPAILGSKEIANFTSIGSLGWGSVWLISFVLIVSALALWHLLRPFAPSKAPK